MQIKLQAKLGDAPLSLAGTLGAPAGLIGAGGTGKPFPVDLAGQVVNAKFTAKGAIADPAGLKGVNLRLAAQIPDLAALAPVTHHDLPPLKSIAFEAQLTDAPGGLAKGVALHNLKLTLPPNDLSGDVAVTLATPPDLVAKLHANRIDAAAVLATFARPAGGGTAAVSPAPAAPPPAPKAAAAGRLFPETPLPFAMLRQANADVTLTANEVTSGNATYRALKTHLVLRGGKLQVDPLTADLPEGHMEVKLSADGTAAAPPVAIELHAPGLAVGPLLAALGQPAYATGKLEVFADLHGAGTSPHAIAASLNGRIGLAMQGGTVDNAALQKALGPMLAKANLLQLLARGGTSQVECFAFRMDPQHGVGEVRTLVLSSSLLSFDGGGSINLGDETMALRLRPQGRVGGTGFVVPLRVSGPLRAPDVSVDAAGAAEANIGTLAGAALGSATPLGMIAGALSGGKSTGTGESCAAPLALARGQNHVEEPKSAPAPAAPQSAPAPQQKAPQPADLLRRLFR